MTYFIEFLTWRTWAFAMLPRLMRDCVLGRIPRVRCFVFDGSRAALGIARRSTWLTGVAVEPLAFRLVDVRDEDGLALRLRIAYRDLAEVQAEALRELPESEAGHGAAGARRFPAYLAKVMAAIAFPQRNALWRVLMTIQVCAWKLRQESTLGRPAVLVLERQPWAKAIERYASGCGVRVIGVAPAVDLKDVVRQRLPRWIRALAESVRLRWRSGGLAAFRHPGRRREPTACAPGAAGQGAGFPRGARGDWPKVAVEYFGHLNLRQRERYSDLFFWQESSIPVRNLLVLFNLSRDPLDERKWGELQREGMGVLALKPEATCVRAAPLFRPRLRRRDRAERIARSAPPRSPGARWVRQQAQEYALLRARWADVFEACGVKVYVSWYKYDGAHCAIADALEGIGGVTAIYQRAYESDPAAETRIAADIVFGFSRLGAEIERGSRSTIPYYVVTGYLGDHRFAALSPTAKEVRDRLQRRGAKRIMAFTDEHSVADARWHSGHEFMREPYAFLLEKVLSEPWLGLVIKPKVPSTLRQRLGPAVATRLQEAEATGRCCVFEEGTMHGSFPPAVAALAADVMVHGHLCAPTAGMEGALAGVPTLLVDREGWSVSPLYRLGIGKVVFTSWPELWSACDEQWARPGGVPGFGDWSALLGELDPFRDGLAAHRMGTYIEWLLEGFRAGLERGQVLADAAARYRERWGPQTILSVNVGGGHEPIDGAPHHEAFIETSLAEGRAVTGGTL